MKKPQQLWGEMVKNSVVKIIFDALLPYYCRGCGRTGSLLCEECRGEIKIIGEVKGKNLGDLKKLYVGGYRTGALEMLVKDYKFKSMKKISGVLVEILDEAMPKGLEAVIVPLPTIKKHIRERGFDHARKLAEDFAKRRGLEVCPVLKRVNKTVQVGADEETREKQAEEAYGIDFIMAQKLFGEDEKAGRLEANRLDPRKTYLLIDDVWTTGASMRAAAKKLREAGVEKIYGIVVEIGAGTEDVLLG